MKMIIWQYRRLSFARACVYVGFVTWHFMW